MLPCYTTEKRVLSATLSELTHLSVLCATPQQTTHTGVPDRLMTG